MEGFRPDRLERILDTVEDVARMCGDFARRVALVGGVLGSTTNCSLWSELDDINFICTDGVNTAGEPCEVARGECVTEGVYGCDENGLIICIDEETREPIPTEAPVEVCNGIDDNCNGEIDEGIPGAEHLGNVCVAGFTVGNNDCLTEGTYQCSPSREAVYCEGVYNNEMPGICDVDKDGVIDSFEQNFVHVGDGFHVSRYPVSMCGENLCITADLKPIEASMESDDLNKLVEADFGEGVRLPGGGVYENICDRFELPPVSLDECREYEEGANPAEAPNCVAVGLDGSLIYGVGITPEQLEDGNVFIGCEGDGLTSDDPAYFRVSINSNPQ